MAQSWTQLWATFNDQLDRWKAEGDWLSPNRWQEAADTTGLWIYPYGELIYRDWAKWTPEKQGEYLGTVLGWIGNYTEVLYHTLTEILNNLSGSEGLSDVEIFHKAVRGLNEFNRYLAEAKNG